MTAWITQYLEAQKRAVDSLKPTELAAVIATVKSAWQGDRQIFAIGNGGSASNASHFALVGAKRGRLAEIASQVIVVDDTHYGRVEDVHMHILHLICYAFMEQAESVNDSV